MLGTAVNGVVEGEKPAVYSAVPIIKRKLEMLPENPFDPLYPFAPIIGRLVPPAVATRKFVENVPVAT